MSFTNEQYKENPNIAHEDNQKWKDELITKLNLDKGMLMLEYAMINQQPGYTKQVQDLRAGDKVCVNGVELTVTGSGMQGDRMAVFLKVEDDDRVYTYRNYPTAWLKEI